MGGGVHFRSKKFRCDFSGNFLGEKGGVTPIRMNFVANFRASQKKRNIFFRKWGGGAGGGGVRGRLEVFRKLIKFGTGIRPLGYKPTFVLWCY